MKEKIYTIPVNEVYETECSCPLCKLESRIEKESVEYALGAAMMEPDFRIESNKRGYCKNHYRSLFKKPNKLSLALILDTHLMEVKKGLESYKKQVEKLSNSPSKVLKKSGAEEMAKDIYDFLNTIDCDCMICHKVNFTMERYIDVILYMYSTEEDFRTKFEKSKGFCFRHFKDVCKMVPKSLSDKQAKEFLPVLYEKELKNLTELQEDIHRFTLKFDYRNKDMPWGNSKDAPIRTIEFMAGNMDLDEAL